MSTQIRPGAVGRLDHGFLAEVSSAAGGQSRLQMCIQCGTCGGSCPSAADMDHTPRMLFAMIRAGMRDAVLASNTPWMCVSCHFCVVRCPQDVHITDVMYALKGIAAKAGSSPDSKAPEFSRVFVEQHRDLRAELRGRPRRPGTTCATSSGGFRAWRRWAWGCSPAAASG